MLNMSLRVVQMAEPSYGREPSVTYQLNLIAAGFASLNSSRFCDVKLDCTPADKRHLA
jgi:hypothetical protein